MLPYIHIGFRDYPVYGLLMAVGAVLGWLLCRSRARLAVPAMKPEQVTRIYLLFGAGALIGAKLYSLALVWPWLVQDLPHFREDPRLFLQHYLYGGLVFYGGLIGGFLCLAWVLAARRARFAQLETVFLPAVPLVHAIGRAGCFCAGCCYGRPTDSWLGVCYPEGGLAPAGIPLVPVQLMESAGDLVLFGLLLLPFYRTPGRRLALYLLGYGALRFTTECFRGDAARGLAGPLSGAQWISLVCLAAGLVLTVVLCLRAVFRPGKARSA